MFTGLIKDLGTIKNMTPNSEGILFEIEAPNLYQEIQIDDSVATNGVCLTATKIQNQSYIAQAVHVTLEKSTLGTLSIGDKVNLELALRPNDRLGGHMVQGHVNGKAIISSIITRGENWEIEMNVPRKLLKYFIDEGSIALDGISLTIAKVIDDKLTVSIIPHTYYNTNLHKKNIGDALNIEVDMMAKYLENFLKFDNPSKLQELIKDV